MDIIEFTDGLQFHKYTVFDQEISHIVADNDAIVPDLQRFLLFAAQTNLTDGMSERIFIYFLQKTAAQFITQPITLVSGNWNYSKIKLEQIEP